MRKNKTNYDIVYENQKDKIVFKIFSDNINEEFISISKDNDDSNNNDTLNFIAKVFIFLETNLYSFYNYLLNYLPSFQRTFYKIQYLFLIIALLFTFVYSYEDNSNISTNLIISAYFPSCSQLTYVKYDNIILEENNIKENNNKNNNKNIKYKDNKNHIKNKNDNNNDCENRYISEDLKSMMSSSANTKNTYVNYEKNINNKITNIDELYSFSIMSIKTFIFSFISFLILYFFIKVTYSSKIRNYLVFNSFCLFIIYNLTNGLYENNYFLASTFMFVLLIYLLKCLIDSIYLFLKYKKKDFEIFSMNLTAVNKHQFLLKVILLTLATIISGFMSISIYKLCLNYILFYFCLLTLMVFLCNCLEPFAPPYLKPIKNLLMFLVGLTIFFLSKFYASKNNINSVFDIDSGDILLIEKEEEFIMYENSLYFVSDLFSLFCFDYLREYIEYKYGDNFKFHKKFTKLDFIIILYFSSCFLIGITGIIKNEYICLIIAIYIGRISIGYFIKKFNTKISRIINHSMIIFFIFVHLKISSRKDTTLINFFSFTDLNSKLLSHIFNFVNLLIIIYFCYKTYYILYYSKENLNKDELKELPEEQVNKIIEFTSNISKQKLKNLKIQIIHDNKKYKMNNIFYASNDLCLNHFELCIIFIILKDYDNNLFIKILYFIFILLLNSIKFFVINEIKNNIEYLSNFFICFIFTLRLLLLSISTSRILHFLCQINLFILISFYSIDKKKNKFITIIIAFHLVFELSKINSFFLAIDLIALILTPQSKEFVLKNNTTSKDKKEKFEELLNRCNISLLFALFILLLFSLQIFGIYNYNKTLNYFHFNNIEELKNNNDNEKRTPIEYYIINEIYSLLQIKKKN